MKLKASVLKQYMLENNLNGLKVSALSGVSYITLSRIQNGASCKYETVLKIARAFNIPVQELIEADIKE